MPNKFKISVIIPTYNRERLLGYTLESLKKQNMDKDCFEVIVADDGSSDNTKSVVRSYAGLLNLKYLYQEDRGYRPASARNIGIAAAEGDICLLIDSGVLIQEDCLQVHIEFHQKNINCAAIGYVYGFEENEQHKIEIEKLIDPSAPCESIERLSSSKGFEDVRIKQYRKYDFQITLLPAPWLYFWTCHVSVMRCDLLRVNLFDLNYDGRWGVEDNDLGFRLCREGISIHLLISARSLHWPHSKNKHLLHKEGFLNCCYFNNKFGTTETQVFLDHYMEKEFFDVNEYILERNNLLKSPPILSDQRSLDHKLISRKQLQ